MTALPDCTTPTRSTPATANTRTVAPRVIALVLLLSTPTVYAADWNTTNVQLLYGTEYADNGGIDDKKKTVFTFEHADGWKYGDNFFFLDTSNPNATGTAHYAEFSPRLSLSALTGKALAFGPIKDTLIAGTWEQGDGVRAYLLGVGFALKLPKFAFADINIYARQSIRDFSPVDTDTGMQVTLDWLLPFDVVGVKFAFEGFFDYAWGEDGGSVPIEENIVSGPRLLIDVGNFVGAPGKLQAGVEWQIWRNKFGINGVDEDVPQAMLKWTL